MLVHQLAPGESPIKVVSISGKKIPQDTDILFVRTGHKMIKLCLTQVLFFQGSGNYVTICTAKSKFLVHNTMRAIEEMVKPFQFVRTHKSYIVALQHIDSIEAGKIMISGHQIPVSESYRDLLTQFIEGNAYIA